MAAARAMKCVRVFFARERGRDVMAERDNCAAGAAACMLYMRPQREVYLWVRQEMRH